MKILVDEDLLYVKQLFSKLGEIVLLNGYNITIDCLKLIDALIVRSVTNVNAELLYNTSVKFVGSVTAGVDHLDLNWLTKSGVKFINAPGCNARSVVEYIFSGLFFLAKRYGFFLRDKIVGIIGVGNIGKLLCQLLDLLEVQTLLCDPPLAKGGAIGNWHALEKLVSEADILTFHVPLIYDGPYATWHMVDDDFLSALPSNRILINTCRGGVFDNYALLRALQNGKKINVILDVWEFEPKILLPLLYSIDIGTPHIAGSSIEGKIRGAQCIFNAYNNFISVDRVVNSPFLLPPIMYYRRLTSVLDEKLLSDLIHSVYDIYHDNISLKNNAEKFGYFEWFRKYYLNRREWSSLYVHSFYSADIEILRELGFS
ncbi:4-phosphoerythronate dehydrogenase [Blochmannia endosymbiont of Colobopsis nipponica]|uniref:4-phosphoerythronate dehydrogenase n=1 Tax=Blochmannia endosymbiont of Colobopsis nipponica TaxID=2681987 RepID=UPI00177D1644|nr:4-phosphoerythronate dehydrogenase [Blochmannia endosymbiont of Colobopsis nipponica]QOI10969.1 4-phosphoerythronate dehydrogenase [Blochmannia endosymbiont of Colobopsis nipponica]